MSDPCPYPACIVDGYCEHRYDGFDDCEERRSAHPHGSEERELARREVEGTTMGVELSLDDVGYVAIWGPDRGGCSWGGDGWIDFDRSGLEWLRDVVIPAALSRLGELA